MFLYLEYNLKNVWILFSEQKVEHLKNVQEVVQRVLNSKPVIDDVLKNYVTSQESKVGQSTNEVEETSGVNKNEKIKKKDKKGKGKM